MEMRDGNGIAPLDHTGLCARIAGFHAIHVDLGTGDGRFVLHSARHQPSRFVVGIDTCRENLRSAARQLPHNALLLIADARGLPWELAGLATTFSINFPWGSLLQALLMDDPGLIAGLRRSARPGATLDVCVNGGALAQAGYGMYDGSAMIKRTLCAAGYEVGMQTLMDARALRQCPSSWARKLAWGPDPWALHLRATLPLPDRAQAHEVERMHIVG